MTKITGDEDKEISSKNLQLVDAIRRILMVKITLIHSTKAKVISLENQCHSYSSGGARLFALVSAVCNALPGLLSTGSCWLHYALLMNALC